MFRNCGRAGVRFASGNVFYMNRTFSARHLQSATSPLSTGFVSPVRFASVTSVASLSSCGLWELGVEATAVEGMSAAATGEMPGALCRGLDMMPFLACFPAQPILRLSILPSCAGLRLGRLQLTSGFA